MQTATFFGGWVRERRRELQLTQKKLARLLGCAPVTVQKIEEGRRRPSPLLAEGLAKHLEIEPQDLGRFLRLARAEPPVPRALPGRTLTPASSLPVAATALLGREEELALIKQKLLAAQPRLLTLTGPPGVGKTRLALQLGHELKEAFADGVRFVPLAPLERPELVLPTLARSLGLSEGGSGLPARLQKHLGDRQILLVLDNFEHLLEAVVGLSGLLEGCPGLRVLATSRQALRLYGEQEWPLEPLALPGPGNPAANPAVRLLVERVQAFDPAFTLDPHSASAVADIVTHLDGLPLALELAAGRLRYLSPGELASQLRMKPLAALGSGPRDWPQRQQTMAGAIAWSYERLEAPLQRVFRHLGVFVGGFDLAAATEVAGASQGDLEALLDAYLIRREGGRFYLLEILRTYALEQLSAEELEAARAAHFQHYLARLEAHPVEDMDWLEAEMGNLRAALQRVLERGEARPALRMLRQSFWFLEVRGYQREGLSWMREALALPGEVEPELRIHMLNRAATMAWQVGDFETVDSWLDIALGLSRAERLTHWEAHILMHRGRVEIERGHYHAALRVLEEALRASRREGSPNLIASTLLQLAYAQLLLGNLEAAGAFTQAGLEVCREVGNSFWEPLLLDIRAQLAMKRGEHAAARSDLLRALSLSEHSLLLTRVLVSLGEALGADPEAGHEQVLQAARLWGAVEAEREAKGLPFSVPDQARLANSVRQAKTRASDLEWNLAWASGRSLSLREALEYARLLEREY
ncbi:ATP-binding protein [Meiothermus hypogaeus]|uniref:HTH cro/C1-type domain-containing protein n=2 Tax=Meiothermus hypogaeus TaxID=884155 RepID=A0A511R795_9DEIN|nr:helix-turn-helix domain-containing protein [Meiothermus hypogaeus]RIH81019.1 putative HTH-type transcriptional regulator [Meiothermus hypogaeus]GEM84856.1 hypothetical protein MHY01S_30220 [Meiothermus hypogaeus NBRC 106114]